MVGEWKEKGLMMGEKGSELGDREIDFGRWGTGDGLSNQDSEFGVVVVVVCDMGDVIMCPSINTGEKDGVSGENTMEVVDGVGVVVDGVLGGREVTGDVIRDGDGGTHGSAQSEESGWDCKLVVGVLGCS